MLKIKISVKTLTRLVHYEVRQKAREKTAPRKSALDYFDFFYSSTYGEEWNKMRLAMLTGRKYTAVVNNFSNRLETVKKLQSLGSLDMFEYVMKQHNVNSRENSSNEKIFPSKLMVYCFDNNDTSKFPSPKSDEVFGSLNYYCIDGASILPVLALDINKDDYILDLCASPGGKTLVMLQTTLAKKIVCRDLTPKRITRLENMLNTFINKDILHKIVDVEFNKKFNIEDKHDELFDKVLADVPCSNDRISLTSDENNMFTKSRLDERTNLPRIQSELLMQAVLSCKVNGTIVYSTCSLSPIQNEGVVNTVLKNFENSKFKFYLKVEPLDYLKQQLNYFYTFSSNCKLGLLVAPTIDKNFGPMYICKISKLAKNT